MSQAGTTSASASGAVTSFTADIGSAAPSGGVINLAGGTGITTSASGNTVTFTNTGSISSITFNTASGSATTSGGAITFTGAGGLAFSGAGSTVTGTLSAIPNSSLAHSSVTVTAGTGLSGGGTVSLGGSITINGTAITATQFDVLVGGAANSIASVGPGSAGQILQSGGNASNPVYSTTTYPSTNAINTLLYASSANVMSALATATTAVLTTSSGVPTWASELSLALGGTNANLTASNGGIFYSTASAGAILSGTATAGQVLLSGSNTAPTWSSNTYPSSDTKGDLHYASATNTISGLAIGSTGNILTVAAGLPAWTTNTYPSTDTAGDLLYASTTNVISGLAIGSTGNILTVSSGLPSWLATADTGVLLTNSSGVPSIVTTSNTYTPTVVGSTTAGTQSYTTQTGFYIQIGPVIMASFNLIGTFGASAAGAMHISLPIANLTVTGAGSWGPSGYCSINSAAPVLGSYRVQSGNSYCVYYVASTGAALNVTASDSFTVQGSILYFSA